MQYLNYNFDDADIRALVHQNHFPIEQGENIGTSSAKLSVLCNQCRVSWPCPQIVGVRNWEAANP